MGPGGAGAARPSSYRRAFGGQTAYSTAGSKQWGNLDPSIAGLINKTKNTNLSRSNPNLAIEEEYATASVNGDTGAQSQVDGDAASISPMGYGLHLSQPISSGYPLMVNKTNEKDQLSNLNTRFQSYIQKVRFLEEQNKKLEVKIKDRTAKATEIKVKPEHIEEIFQLRENIDDLTVIKAKLQVERDNLRGDAMELKNKLEEENNVRNDLDDELARLRKDVDDATMVRVDLERKIETLKEELEYNRKVHQDEQQGLKTQIEGQGLSVECDGVAPDITEMLRQIRNQYDTIAVKHRDEAEQWYKKKCEDLESKSKTNQADLEKVAMEINEYRRQVTQLEMELESLRGTNEYLERNLQDVEKRYEMDLQQHQNRLNRMQGDLDKATNELKRHIAEYKNLMTIKLNLEKELDGYKDLLDEEDIVDVNGHHTTRGGAMSESKMPNMQGKPLHQKTETSSDSDTEESVEVKTTKRVFIKTIETKDGKILSQKTEEKSGNLASTYANNPFLRAEQREQTTPSNTNIGGVVRSGAVGPMSNHGRESSTRDVSSSHPVMLRATGAQLSSSSSDSSDSSGSSSSGSSSD